MRVSFKLGLSYLAAILMLSVMVNVWGRSICRDKASQTVKDQLMTIVSRLSDNSVMNFYEESGSIVRIRQ